MTSMVLRGLNTRFPNTKYECTFKGPPWLFLSLHPFVVPKNRQSQGSLDSPDLD